jgi:hypothetical protein
MTYTISQFAPTTMLLAGFSGVFLPSGAPRAYGKSRGQCVMAT